MSYKFKKHRGLFTTKRFKPIFNIFTFLAVLTSLLGSAVSFTPAQAASFQTDITGPTGSGKFGYSVTTLPNGNFVVTDPFYDAPGPIADVGAVYLYNGATHALISTLTGSTANDQVGSDGVVVLTNGNYVVASPNWDSSKGAVTFGNGTTGVSGAVSALNSLVGSTAGTILDLGDYIGAGWMGAKSVIALTNGNYVVASPFWNEGKGAVTWGNGTTGTTGIVSALNSLVGSTLNDNVGTLVTPLTNGNYVVSSYSWDGVAAEVGAVTWGNGTGGTTGVVSAANSLVGSTLYDQVGSYVTALTNGNYVVPSPSWDGMSANVGAITWGNGTGGTTGIVSAANSLVGSTANDNVGNFVAALTNGNYVVGSQYWDDVAMNVGAVTWGNGTGGTTGTVSTANSLVGSTANDNVGKFVTALTNGNFVVASPNWDGMVADVGAATWGNGMGGTTGTVSAANSLVGSTAGDSVGASGGMMVSGVTALTNGNYVVPSAFWDGVAVNVGAATWGNGMGGTTGAVSAANSLVGSTAGDSVGSDITALTNGNYVVGSRVWDGAVVDAGATTWGNGTSGITGTVSALNSLVGSTTSDYIGGDMLGIGITALLNGNYVVASPFWNGAIVDGGAITWGNGTTGTTGEVSALNSLIGSTANDFSSYSITALTNGNYVVRSPNWDNGAIVDAGAITLSGFSGLPIVGSITSANSVRGTTASGGNQMNFGYDYVNDQLVVGRPADNIVTLLRDDTVEPTALSSLRASASPTSLSSVDFTVAFSEAVTGVDISDFSLTTTGVSGASVSGVSGAGSTYTITVNTGSGNGTLRLNVLDDDTILDAALNPLGAGFTNGEIYSVIKSASFADVPMDYWASSYIERLYNAGITGGCSNNPLSYCPESTVTRAQMAVFLLKGIHGSSYTPPAVGGSTGFNDVAIDYWAAAWVKQLATESITGGCGGGNYCPDNPVTRAQMAVFLLKAKYGSSYAPPAIGSDSGFTDVPADYWAAAWIKQLAAEGITSGCAAGTYCPENAVNRAQMAVFLVKTFNLP